METPINKALQTFANLMIDKIKLLSDDKKARQGRVSSKSFRSCV